MGRSEEIVKIEPFNARRRSIIINKQSETKHFNVRLHSEVYGVILFKPRKMIVITKLYVLGSVYLAYTCVYTPGARSRKILRSNEILDAVWTFWSDKASSHFIWHDYCSTEPTSLRLFSKKEINL